MQLHSNAGGLADTNAYLLIDEATHSAALIDAPKDTTAPLLKRCRDHRLNLTHLLLTHGHWDHVSDHAAVTAAFPKAKVMIHRLEEPKLQNPGSTLMELPYTIPPRSADAYLEDNAIISVGNLQLQVLHTPGHAVGHCCFFLASAHHPILFAGDLLMAGTVGRYDLPGDGDLPTLIASLRRVMALPNSTHILPGHGAHTKIAHERNGNPFLRERGII